MNAFLTIMWFLGTCLSITMVFEFVGYRGLTKFFPESRRLWHLPAQLASLGFFALMVLINPFD